MHRYVYTDTFVFLESLGQNGFENLPKKQFGHASPKHPCIYFPRTAADGGGGGGELSLFPGPDFDSVTKLCPDSHSAAYCALGNQN